jgi:hypothetical protein
VSLIGTVHYTVTPGEWQVPDRNDGGGANRGPENRAAGIVKKGGGCFTSVLFTRFPEPVYTVGVIAGNCMTAGIGADCGTDRRGTSHAVTVRAPLRDRNIPGTGTTEFA